GVARLVLPGLAQLGVDPDLQARWILPDPAVLGGDLGPCLPGRIERGEVEARGTTVALGRRAPLARGQHAGLLVVVMDAAAGIADQIGLVAPSLGPADACPGDRGHVAAMEAGDVVEALVAVLEGCLDTGMALQRRRRDHVE